MTSKHALVTYRMEALPTLRVQFEGFEISNELNDLFLTIAKSALSVEELRLVYDALVATRLDDTRQLAIGNCYAPAGKLIQLVQAICDRSRTLEEHVRLYDAIINKLLVGFGMTDDE